MLTCLILSDTCMCRYSRSELECNDIVIVIEALHEEAIKTALSVNICKILNCTLMPDSSFVGLIHIYNSYQ